MPVEVAPSRQAGGRPPRRDSDIASAARRISLSQRTSISRIQQVDVERAQKAAQAKDVRRRSSLARMWVTDSARSQVQSLLEDAASEISTGESKGEGPQRRLQHLLSSAKERGMSAERLFEYFAPDGASTISRDAFELALDSIAPTYGKLSSEDINELFCDFDSNGNGVIDLSEFVEWCMAIPTLAWKAEKARQLGNCDSTDNLAEAARNIERRRSLSKAIPIGKKLYEGKKFFWRTKENMDIAIHENEDEGIVTINTRSHEMNLQYEPIFVEATKLPITSKDVACAVEEKLSKRQEDGELQELSPAEMKSLRVETRESMIVSFLLNRLKVPDNANEPPSPKRSPKRSSGDESLGPQRPFLQRLSTDKEGSIRSRRGITLESMYRFDARPQRNSVDDFRRVSADCTKLINEAGGMIHMAEGNVVKLEEQVKYARRLSRDMGSWEG